MKIDIKHIAKLSCLHVDEQNIPNLEKQMSDMITMVEHLPELSSGNLSLSVENKMELRKDEIKPSYSRDSILMNAPQKQAGCIVVPKVVG
jgi:aspartyl-tRNA(Asn)/glutamyl-tRNA(Gln) amidotransferase subunit C